MDLMPSRAAAVAGLTDAELESRLMGLTAVERKATALLLAHLGEFDRRRLYADRGQPSLFQYCVNVLGYSEQAAYKRIQAARAAWAHPVLLERLWRGELHLAAIVILAPHFRRENLDDLLDAARGKSKPELEAFAAGLAPRVDCLDLLRALPAVTRATPDEPAISGTSAFNVEAEAPRTTASGDSVLAIEASPEGPREKVEALSAERFLFRFSGSADLRAKYFRARSLLHSESARKMESVFDSALEALLDRADPDRRLKRRESRRRRAQIEARESRIVPRTLRDEVWSRDGGRCVFSSSDGIRCPATERLEIDHIRPYALGGRSDIGNLRLLCRAHNLLAARRIFGPNYPRG
jgi:5-methylcytosine-specific restriction endonuclease McrA